MTLIFSYVYNFNIDFFFKEYQANLPNLDNQNKITMTQKSLKKNKVIK